MKIQYQDKEAIDLQPNVPAKNKVTDADMNEIKTVVNKNADTLDGTVETVTNFVNDVDDRLGTVENTTVEVVARMDSAEEDIADLQEEVNNIEDTTYTKTEVDGFLTNEANARENADNNLQNQIDGIVASSDVVDIVGTYQDLQNYDTSKLGDNDIIKVLSDSTHNNATSYFRWKKALSTWQYIGSEGPYYTKAESDSLLGDKVDKIPGKGLSENDFTNALLNKLNGIQAGAQVNSITGVKGNAESSYRTGNVNITKANIGLGNVDNTSDANKPVSNATATELNKKVNKTDIVTSLSSSSTNSQVPGAKVTYNQLQLKENASNKVNTLDNSTTHYPTSNAVKTVTDGLGEDIEENTDDIDALKEENENQQKLLNALLEIAPRTDYEEGSNITLNNTVPYKLEYEDDKVGYGDTEQGSTTGKQLFNNSATPTSTSGANSRKIDTGIEVKLNSSSDNNNVRYVIKDLLGYENKVVRIKCKAKSNSTNPGCVYLRIVNEDGSFNNSYAAQLSDTTLDGELEKSYTIPSTLDENGHYLCVAFYGTRNVTANIDDYVNYTNVIVTIDNEDMTYEQYTGGQASPNPSYPFPVKTVTGTQTVTVRSKNLCDTKSKLENAVISSTEITTGTYTLLYKKIKAGTYTISSSSTMQFVYCFTDEAPTTSTTGITRTVVNSITQNTFTAPKDCYIVYRILFYTGATLDDTSDLVRIAKEIMLSEGSSASPYQPYITPTIKTLSLGTLELCKIGTYRDYIWTDRSTKKWYKRSNVVKQIVTSQYINGLAVFNLQSINSYGIANFLLQNFSNTEEGQYGYEGMCNYFSRQESLITNTQIEGILYQPRNVYIRVKSTTASTAQEFKTYVDSLNTNGDPLIIYRPLGVFVDTEITDTTLKEQLEEIYNLFSVDKTTVIEITGELPMITKVRSLKNNAAELASLEARVALLEG